MASQVMAQVDPVVLKQTVQIQVRSLRAQRLTAVKRTRTRTAAVQRQRHMDRAKPAIRALQLISLRLFWLRSISSFKELELRIFEINL
jgi:hypothetical protein